MEASSSSIRQLEQCVEQIYKQNFDDKTKVCMKTMIKILDNIIQKPHEEKVRQLRLSNPAIEKKIGSCNGGIEFLMACGFQKQQQEQILDGGNGEWFLILPIAATADNNNTLLITARRLLTKCCIQDLGMNSDDLPKYKNPPPPATTTQSQSQQQSSSFNPYQTHRYDGISSAAGMQLTPDSNYVSTTDQQLQILQKKQQQLEKKMQNQKTVVDRNWFATHPATSTSASVVATSTSSTNKSDSTLLMESYQKKVEQQQKLENQGFTTKNMRELEKLKKAKVYSHVQLAIQLSNGITLHGKFLPKETIQTVMNELVANCFVNVANSHPQYFQNLQLYITPPRRVLQSNKTLTEEELVPAAKVFCKFHDNTKKTIDLISSLIKPELFQQNTSGASLPQSQAVVANNNNSAAAKNQDDKKPAAAAAETKKLTKEEKEEELMKRMMGGGKRKKGGGGLLGGFGRKQK